MTIHGVTILGVVLLDAVMPLIAVATLVILRRRGMAFWRAYVLVGFALVTWSAVVMHLVGHNLTAYLLVGPVAVALGALGVALSGPVSIFLGSLLAWIVVPMGLAYVARRVARLFSPAVPDDAGERRDLPRHGR